MDATLAQLEQWDREHIWHPFTPMQQYCDERPLLIDRADGCMLIDTDGNEYIDGVSSLWCNVHGHRVKELDEAIIKQLGSVAHSTLLGISNVPAVKLARRLVELCRRGWSTFFFSDNGSTAVEVVLKMAFQYWRQRANPLPKKTKFLSLTDAYHGDTIGSTSVGGIERFHFIFGPLLFPTIHAPSPYCYRCPLGLERKTCHTDCLEEMARLIEQHHEELAAVVVEPLVQGAAGSIVVPDGYLRRSRTDQPAQRAVDCR